MKRYVIDIETDGLNPTVVHCIVAANVSDVQDTLVWEQRECYDAFPDWCAKLLADGGQIIGHNFISYDAPVLNRLVSTNIQTTDIIDTLVMSYLYHPTREGHGLAWWGEQFDYAKTVVEQDEWLTYTPLILERCKRDVVINYKTFVHLCKEGATTPQSVYWREAKVRAIVDRQEANGFALDIPVAMGLQAKLRDEADRINEQIQVVFPPQWVFKAHTKESEVYVPKRDNQTRGYVADCPISKVELQTFNLQSNDQVATRLMDKGWKPTRFTDTGKPSTDEGALNGIDATKIPEAAPIQRFLMLEKRLSQIKGWLEAVDDDNLVHGSVMTCGAVTSRMKHSKPNMANITSIKSEYGVEMRACWVSRDPDNYKLVGTDASSLELRCLAHHMNDPAYTKEVVEGDVHIVNMNALGITDRDMAKTYVYAFLYGAGVAKIATILGCNMGRAKNLITKFLNNLPALKTLKESVSEAAKSGKVKALDNRMLHVRHEHAALNTLLQGAGAIICKEWLVQLITLLDKEGIDYRLVGSVHDEYIFEVHKDHVAKFPSLSSQAMTTAERVLNVNCPLECETMIGNSWAETH